MRLHLTDLPTAPSSTSLPNASCLRRVVISPSWTFKYGFACVSTS